MMRRQVGIFHDVLMEGDKNKDIWLDRQILVKAIKGTFINFMSKGDSGCAWFDIDGNVLALGSTTCMQEVKLAPRRGSSPILLPMGHIAHSLYNYLNKECLQVARVVVLHMIYPHFSIVNHTPYSEEEKNHIYEWASKYQENGNIQWKLLQVKLETKFGKFRARNELKNIWNVKKDNLRLKVAILKRKMIKMKVNVNVRMNLNMIKPMLNM
ncbi:hypothetical protein GLOIN_2v1482823 [Rhizophagus irregularis DAOM 181602=DAOM 197198]|uniref:Myb-like domain-containing protein n=1 Tax=Rhizophagus irregularis (strain DAOM 181602 / DAOM 197198 / MUCL 43194) TaxID=747089 RepID=A0A2P4PK85_RHIID|nr:hypothetical protein GLOIN_2v1482823 [Rhizophagus irregularis DAOM 181602=DAOM 197198]POG65813.1 hypothetical protein GLOIN_2v1482823 [Rhizophagus irregularis DAOM 181602=DAOM 197198]|eukprot:XP_025172679.1 hypothetical protein GLOIN_2v1482823 [Rhizophagus irregularis DAOM 181602=DAOM 197198]